MTRSPSLRRLPSTVIALGMVSLFTDMAGEMIYPLLPGFLAVGLGAGAIALGAIEGVAESTAALVKLASGVWSDRLTRRKPLIAGGYSFAAAVRPLIGLATSWIAVLAIRFADRVGKGLRSSPRDALISDITPADLRGTAFGLHRAMDHAGAVAGPLAAAALLHLAGVSLRNLFLLAAIPGAIVIVLVLFVVKETPRVLPPPVAQPRLLAGWGDLGPEFRRLLIAVAVFTLGNSTDAFLLLRLGAAGIEPYQVALLWSAHHVVKMGATYLGGRLSDARGRKPLLACGWLVYAAVYIGFALIDSAAGLIGLFFVYGLYFGLTEPVERAWIADLAPADRRGTAFGWYHAAVGLAALPASLVFGVVWAAAGPGIALGAGAALAIVALAIVLGVRSTPATTTPSAG